MINLNSEAYETVIWDGLKSKTKIHETFISSPANSLTKFHLIKKMYQKKI